MNGKQAIGLVNMAVLEAIDLIEKHREEIAETIGKERYEKRRARLLAALTLLDPPPGHTD